MAKRHTTKGIVVATALAAALTGVLTRGEDRQPGQSLRAFDYGSVVETEETQEIVVRYGANDYDLFPARVLKEDLGAHREVGFVIKPKGRDFWSAPQTMAQVVPLLADKLEGAKLEQRWWVKALSDGWIGTLYRRDSDPTALMNTPGTHPIDLVVGTVVQHFPRVQNLGIFACKRISGSSTGTWSQHSYYGGNAVDFGGPGAWGSDGYVAYLDDVNDFIADLWDSGDLPVAQLGWRNWANHYPGHIHVSGSPMFSGTPGCAS